MDTRIRIIAEAITKDAENGIKLLIDAEKELLATTEALRVAKEKGNTSTNTEIGLIKKLEDEISNLTKLRKNSNDLAEISAYTRQIETQNNVLKTLTSTQKEVNDAKQKSTVLTKEQNEKIQSLTGSTEKSNGMFKNLAATMLGLFAVDRIIDYSKQMFELVINSDRMNIALKNVTQSNTEYHQSLGFLNKLSNDYGQNVNTLKESYVSFLASSKSTNLSVKERQGIYESIIKAGSALTLSNDAIEGSLRAVSQMFSKGNVSAEELRGQLGERLPGAFGIMAEALGVNEKKLNKMLEQGEVLAEDALPKFAKALEAAYGDKAKSNIDTVTGASNRFGRSLTENLTKINESTGFTKALASGINFLADNFKSLVNVMVGAGAALAAYTLKQTASSAIGRIQLINLGQQVLAKQAASVATVELNAAETAAAAAATRFNAAVAAAPWGIALVALSAFVTMVMEHNDAVQKAYELTEAGIKATDEEIKGERAHAVELGVTIEQTKKLAYGTEERLSNVRKLMAQYPQYFKDMTEEQVSNWHLTNAYRGVNKEIERKITLLAREKSVQGLTNRAAEIKAELEQLGVFTTNMNEYNKQTETFKNSFKDIRGKILEYNQVMLNLDKTTLRLTDSQKQMFNQEAQNNKAKLQAGLISEKEFKAEVMRIQEVYGIKVQNYKLEEKAFTNLNTNKSKADKELNKQMAAEKAAFQQKISDIDNRGEEERAFEREKQIKKIYPIYSQSYDKIQKVTESFNKSTNEASAALSKSLTDRIGDDFEQLTIRLQEEEKLRKKAIEAYKTSLNGILDKFDEFGDKAKGIVSAANEILGPLFDNLNDNLQKELESTQNLVDKEKIQIKLDWVESGKTALTAANQFVSGNYVGATLSTLKFLGDAMNNLISKDTRIFNAMLAEREIQLKKIGEAFSQYSEQFSLSEGQVSDIKEIYGTLLAMGDTPIFDDGTFQGALNTQIEIGKNIIDNYNKSMENEEKTYNTSLSNENKKFEDKKDKEQKRYDDAIDKINKQYSTEVDRINEKYDLIFAKNNQKFDAESLAIQQGVNSDLMSFVENQDLKLGLVNQFEIKKAQIAETFALAYKPITDGMSQAEIDGINAAIKARDEQFAKLEEWQTGQIKFVIDNGKLQIDTYSQVEKTIQKGKDDTYELGLKYQELEIANNITKNEELDVALKAKNKAALDEQILNLQNIAINQTIHNLAMEAIEKNYNDNVLALGLAKDTALKTSFEALKTTIANGYDEIVAKALEAYNAGQITADKYNEIVNRLFTIKSMIGDIDWSKLYPNGLPTTTPNTSPSPFIIEPIVIPGFKTGTEMVGGIKGIDKNLAWLSNDEAVLQGDLNKKRLDKGINRFEMVEYAINYKSILDGGFQPLQIKTSALDKLEEHKAMQYLINMNVGEIVDKLSQVEKSILGKPTQIFDLSDGKLREYVKTDKNVTIFKNKRLK